jgi:glyoxylase-like metal-dependent hydrolase (beta-lactamase superfamily II)
MDVQEIAPGLWHWTAPHPEWTPKALGEDGLGWGETVSSYAVVADDAFVLIDPQVPTDEADAARFWDALDRDVASHGPPRILVTIHYHVRSTAEIAERYAGTETWAPVKPGDTLPAGIIGHDLSAFEEIVLELPQHRALVFGDAVLDGPRLCPGDWLPKGRTQDELARAIRPLLAGKDLLLLTHGGPTAASALEV